MGGWGSSASSAYLPPWIFVHRWRQQHLCDELYICEKTMNIQYTLEHPRGDFHGNPSRCLCKPPGGIISRVLSPDVPRPSTFSRWGTRGKSPVEENQAFGLLSTVLVQHSGWGPPEKFGGPRFNGPLGGPQKSEPRNKSLPRMRSGPRYA